MISTIFKQIICSIIILFLWSIVYAIKRNIFPNDIVFYESILFSFFLFLILFLFLKSFEIRFKKIISYSILPSFLLVTLFNATVPTILDRSVSITVLGTLKKSESSVGIDHINKSFQQIYVINENAVEIRLKEQIANGNVVQNDFDEYALTRKGEFITDVMLHLTYIYNLNNSYVDQ